MDTNETTIEPLEGADAPRFDNAPIGVFGLMAYTVSMHGLSVLLPLIKLVLVMYLACILQILIVYLHA